MHLAELLPKKLLTDLRELEGDIAHKELKVRFQLAGIFQIQLIEQPAHSTGSGLARINESHRLMKDLADDVLEKGIVSASEYESVDFL